MIELSKHLTLGDKWLYDILFVEKQEIFPSEYQLDVLYIQDQFNHDAAVGKSLLKLQEFLATIGIPNFFVTVHTNKQDIKDDLIVVRDLFALGDVEIKFNLINGQFNKKVIKQDTLCILPWIHLHINPQGRIGTCCKFDTNYPLGHISENNLQDIINGKQLKLVRKQMLAGQRPDICSSCWQQEDLNLVSQRQLANSADLEKYSDLVAQTEEDGEFKNFKLKSFDVRPSNICNLKCRMCGGKYSSRIAQEEIDLYPDIHTNRNFVELKLNSDEIKNVLDFVEHNINDVELVYFAGGEPLIMSEHYKILDLLIQRNRTDVSLRYSTNLSILKYKDLDILNYWSKFKNVNVGASIDLIGPQADYVRSGVEYHVLEKNYLAIKDYVNFKIESCMTIYNSFNLMELQKHWILKFGISADAFNIVPAMVLPGEVTSCQILPKHFKELVSLKINQHLDWLAKIDNSVSLVKKWQYVLYYMNSVDQSHLLKEFFRLNDDKDRIRNVIFEEMFPEFQTLRSYV
jgi:radical SAM protein with 4Fe4S-binding SPASM domain